MTQTDVLSTDVLSPRTFCPPDVLSDGPFVPTDVLSNGRFVATDVLSPRTFCPYGRFVHGRFVSGRFVSGRFVWAPEYRVVYTPCWPLKAQYNFSFGDAQWMTALAVNEYHIRNTLVCRWSVIHMYSTMCVTRGGVPCSSQEPEYHYKNHYVENYVLEYHTTVGIP